MNTFSTVASSVRSEFLEFKVCLFHHFLLICILVPPDFKTMIDYFLFGVFYLC